MMLRFKRCIICYLGIIGSLVLLMNSAQADSLLGYSSKTEMNHKTYPTVLLSRTAPNTSSLFYIANDVQEFRETFQETQQCFVLCVAGNSLCRLSCMNIDGELGEQCDEECDQKENECNYQCTEEEQW